MSKPFIVTTDASCTSIGYILSQKDDLGQDHPICFQGRSLNSAEKKYTISELECLALVEAIKAFEPYLSNQTFTVITDHAALRWLDNIKPSTGRLARWALLLQGYNYEVIHRPGKANKNADALSRRPYSNCQTVEHDFPDICAIDPSIFFSDSSPKEVKIPKGDLVQVELEYKSAPDTVMDATVTIVEKNVSDKVAALSIANVAEDQQICPDLGPIYNYLVSKELPDDGKQAKCIVAESDQYIIEDNILYHLYTPRSRSISKENSVVKQLAIPSSLRDEVLKSYHDALVGGGHQGFDRTYASIRAKYYWPRMYRDILAYVKSCQICQFSKTPRNSKKAPLKAMPINDRFERWHIDILGPIKESSQGYKYILLVVESFSRWSEAFPLKTQEASEIANILYREIFTRFGAPHILVSDRGRNFLSNLVRALCELFQVARHHTSAYHPQSNSVCERMNSTIAQSLRSYCNETQTDWPEILPGILMAYRMTPCTNSTSYSPFYLLFGQEMKTPLDTQLSVPSNLPQSIDTYLKSLSETLNNAKTIAKQNILKAQNNYTKSYDKGTKQPMFSVGDLVLLHSPKVPVGLSPKLYKRWIGPYYVTKCGPNFTYELRHSTTHKVHTSLVHANRLKMYNSPMDRPLHKPVEDNQSKEVSDKHDENKSDKLEFNNDTDKSSHSDDWLPARRLLRSKLLKSKRHYLVEWEDGEPTWEPSSNVSEALKQNFHISRKTRKGRR